MPSEYLPSLREKYQKLPGSDLRQLNLKLRPDAWAALTGLKRSIGDQRSMGAFTRSFLTAALQQAAEEVQAQTGH